MGVAIPALLCLAFPLQAAECARSPDGRDVAWTVTHGRPAVLLTEIWASAADGARPRQIAACLGEASDLQFIANGEGVVFLEHSLVTTAFGSHLVGPVQFPLVRNRVWRVGLGGSPKRLWPIPEDLQPVGIAVSPGGDRLAVQGYLGDLLDRRDRGVWAVGRDGVAARVFEGRVEGPMRWSSETGRIGCRLPDPSGARWISLGLDGSLIEDASLPGGPPESAAPSGQVQIADGHDRGGLREGRRLLTLVDRAINEVARARKELREGDRDAAREACKRGIRHFGALRGGPGGPDLGKEDCSPYVRMLESWYDLRLEEQRQLICQEHMLVLAHLVHQYASAHAGTYPADLDSLASWIQTIPGPTRRRSGVETARTISTFCHCPADPDEGRAISYLYLPDSPAPGPELVCLWHRGCLQTGVPLDGVRTTEISPVLLDSLETAAEEKLEAGEAQRSVELLERITHQDPDDADAFLLLGHARLAEGEVDRAKDAFDRAVHLGERKTLARAYYGMGLVYLQRPYERYMAIDYFRDAWIKDPTFADARHQMAQIRYKLREHDTKHVLEEVLEIDPDRADATMMMGDWYSDFAEEHENAIVWYAKCLSMQPDDPEVVRRLGVAYLELKEYDRIVDTLLGFAQQHPEAIGLFPIVAQACVKRDKPELALEMFDRYLSEIDAEERELYEDVELISSRDEYREYRSLSREEMQTFLVSFWNGRDPDLSTPVNERLLEHYRRVWYSRTHFARGKKPWDRRGEVYIRFGEPDHKTSSRMTNAEQSLDVQRVKELMALELYGAEAAGKTFIGTVYPVRSKTFAGQMDVDRSYDATDVDFREKEEASLVLGFGEAAEEADGDSVDTGEGESEYWYKLTEFQPVTTSRGDLSNVPWESWVYTRIGGGIEITFTDETLKGIFDYAPMPLAPDMELEQLRRFARYAPGTVHRRAAAAVPDHYIPEYEAQPYEFYFDIADFRGSEGSRALEVYYGMPNASARYRPEEDRTELVVSRQAALVASDADTVFRTAGHLVYRTSGDRRTRGAFVPDVARLEVPPGVYRMEVRARNRLNGRLGIYRKSVVVKDYATEELMLSDLQLAWRIVESQEEGKFAKQGLHVIPLPTRTFRKGLSVYVYFEIYNLTRDAYGQTRYQVQYTVRPKGGTGLGGIVAQLAQTFTGKKREEVAVGFEQVGLGESEAAYVELDLGDSRAGRYELRVEVTDMNSGTVTGRETIFRVEE
ncbi:MAG: GWxTD domain-containing protein [Candidatus Latescibacteria bacterium]|nr:GWxTD domain-containing protein [Candidatus Latescibacterota bacterium]